MDWGQIKNESTITTGNVKLYLCDICNECYSLERSFKLHYRAHKSFPCAICKQVFTLKGDLKIHLRTHNESQNEEIPKYICAECDEKFLSKHLVKKHMKCHEKKRYICKICKTEFGCIKKLRRHNITHKIHVCEGCRSSFHYISELKAHTCVATVQAFNPSDATIDYLKQNPLRTHNETMPKYICAECDKEFLTKIKLKNHRRSHKKKQYVCKICKTMFGDIKKLRRHKITHKNHVCESCQARFHYKSELKKHACAAAVQVFQPYDATIDYLKHPDIKQEVVDCEANLNICSENGKSHSIHVSAIKQEPDHSFSSPDKPYFCKMCGKGFKRNSSLATHICAIKKSDYISRGNKKRRKSITTLTTNS